MVADRLKEPPVTVGLRNDLDLEILEGLRRDDRIVAVADTEMRDGDSVDWPKKVQSATSFQ